MSGLKYLVIHCTATPEGRKVSKADIEQWHLKERGWSKVGYSDMIHIDGTLENLIAFNQDDTVDNWEISNGASGFNGVARHVVYVGGSDKGMQPKDTRTSAQNLALEKYVKYMILRHPHIKVVGHNELSSKACPSFNVGNWLRGLQIPSKHIGR
ncbi:N-acetylmuramoyl-L-alanine amidase [Winogradskyella phage Peternella_1]|uniref:N-acetylmuramoyl-L-alanine amidase n=1 Tax=Winogradskyella phage Peternella_1 TaxID=2745699 RepID=A0A8E4ZMZ5_9CAUD|nr:amidase [Winogradskyella phage Peternella_1]QQV91577.1 N-acetylmuramoyl-L-alanine amidase [Winogradskyella phage Peternella_1]